VAGIPVAVTGDRNGMVRVWDLLTGAPHGGPLHGPVGRVTALAVGEADSAPAVVSGNDNGSISMWVLDGGQRASVRLEAPAAVTAIGFAGHHGWLTSSSDGSLFVWRPNEDVKTLAAIGHGSS
jgi:WD40 repeat protein